MNLRYLGRSAVQHDHGHAAVRFSPNLDRPAVFYDAQVAEPVRFREAISALHEIVVSDLRVQKKDRTAWTAWKAERDRALREEEEVIRAAAWNAGYTRGMEEQAVGEPPAALVKQFHRAHDTYWKARRKWASELTYKDPELFRHLVPCDPVVTVAPDVVYFEGFARDESSYGCLFVDRDAFTGESTAGLGTTNVDYSLALYEHFQTLRSYRPTRLKVDPTGFEVEVQGAADYREEKIDLPPSWLRGFGQLQAAMALPSQTVTLPVEAVYSVLAHLKRHREKGGPRCIEFHLEPGRSPTLVLQPWGTTITTHGVPWVGARPEVIKVWGRRRLMVMARLLPLAERFEVRLLGTGLPSIWIAHMGPMRFVLGLSGWTANSWTAGANLDLLAGHHEPDPALDDQLCQWLEREQSATLAALLQTAAGHPRSAVLGSLHTLAKQGQLIYDFTTERYRYRQVMPVALSSGVLGPEPEELTEGRRLFQQRLVTIARTERFPNGKRYIEAHVDGTRCEATFDADGFFAKARCSCSHHFRFKLRAGPCRHLLALKLTTDEATAARSERPATASLH